MTLFKDLLEFHKRISPDIEDADLYDIKESLREIHKLQVKLSRRYADISTFIEKRDRMNRPSKVLRAIAKEKEKANNDNNAQGRTGLVT